MPDPVPTIVTRPVRKSAAVVVRVGRATVVARPPAGSARSVRLRAASDLSVRPDRVDSNVAVQVPVAAKAATVARPSRTAIGPSTVTVAVQRVARGSLEVRGPVRIGPLVRGRTDRVPVVRVLIVRVRTVRRSTAPAAIGSATTATLVADALKVSARVGIHLAAIVRLVTGLIEARVRLGTTVLLRASVRTGAHVPHGMTVRPRVIAPIGGRVPVGSAPVVLGPSGLLVAGRIVRRRALAASTGMPIAVRARTVRLVKVRAVGRRVLREAGRGRTAIVPVPALIPVAPAVRADARATPAASLLDVLAPALLQPVGSKVRRN